MLKMICIFAFLFSGSDALPDLQESVEQYWSHLINHEKAEALSFVSAESRERFLQRDESLLRNWHLISIEAISEELSLVKVSVERMIQGGFHRTEVVETWHRHEGQWRVVMPDTSDGIRQVFVRSKGDRFEEDRLVVVPQVLKIHFLSRSQSDAVVVWNGSNRTVELERIEIDAKKFQVIKRPSSISPRTSEEIEIKYLGQEDSKNLKSAMTLQLRIDSEVESFDIPIIYNYLSPAAMGLFGLSPAKAEELKRSDVVEPRIELPQK